MRRIAGWMVATLLAGAILPRAALAEIGPNGPVEAAAEKFTSGITWRESTVLVSDFTCTGKVQFAILGASLKEIVVAIFTDGLTRAPALLRFETTERNILASKIRLDDYSLTTAEITDVTGTPPVGYRQSTTCHGVRLSDDSYEAAHIYWDHDHQQFDSWAQ